MRVFVFRPEPDAERTARIVADHGFEPMVAPLFKVVRLSDIAPEGSFDAIVLTSGNAVPMLAEGPADWRDLPVFTVGARTAAKVREAGLDDARSADGDRNDLIDLIGRTLPAPAKLLMIAARDRKEDVSERLKAAGYDVALWTAYAAEPVSALPEDAIAALRLGKVDAALHYSARGARTFIALAQAAGVVDAAMELTHVTLSADVASPLIASGASTVLVAEYPEEAAMLSALEQVLARDAASAKPATKPRGSLKRTPPTIELTAEAIPEESEPVAVQADAAVEAHPPEAVAPTEALPEEFTPPPVAPASAPAERIAPARMPWLAVAVAGLAGGVVGAGLVFLGLNQDAPTVSVEQIVELRNRIDAVQTSAAATDRKATGAAEAAAKAGSDVQGVTSRIAGLANAPATDTSALAAQAQRAEAAVAALGQRLDQVSGRVGAVETQAKSSASLSPEATAAARIVLAERVRQALAAGRPFAGEVPALTKLGVAPAEVSALTAVASSGAPTRETLLAGFRKYGATFQREVMPASESWTEKLIGLTSRIVTVRPVGDNGSNDPATLPVRLEAAIAAGDMVRAAALWGQLPEPARRASADFGTDLQRRAAADAAIAKIAQDAVAALGAAG
ncbi:uroporphyrinogen-III synthase [Bosea sp. BH3]|uniref:uroporphyrinogen-III synthase n=1 Tax=Bosea sp. BH3 TaxID=2871701 RepID=UPI0021CB30CF|nr:uroporphyrinogen-III synthase [Bosea sp. BH3]MCU4178412.1 uroporphyrinogen-III synthase [Bosea sp. BH3]